jgi:RimJ/RimL family protein N-acetyltransferase
VMREATAYAFDELGLDVLTGEVLEHNAVVRQMNRRFRFVEGTPEIRYADGRELTVIPISLRKQDRRKGKS